MVGNERGGGDGIYVGRVPVGSSHSKKDLSHACIVYHFDLILLMLIQTVAGIFIPRLLW